MKTLIQLFTVRIEDLVQDTFQGTYFKITNNILTENMEISIIICHLFL